MSTETDFFFQQSGTRYLSQFEGAHQEAKDQLLYHPQMNQNTGSTETSSNTFIQDSNKDELGENEGIAQPTMFDGYFDFQHEENAFYSSNQNLSFSYFQQEPSSEHNYHLFLPGIDSPISNRRIFKNQFTFFSDHHLTHSIFDNTHSMNNTLGNFFSSQDFKEQFPSTECQESLSINKEKEPFQQPIFIECKGSYDHSFDYPQLESTHCQPSSYPQPQLQQISVNPIQKEEEQIKIEEPSIRQGRKQNANNDDSCAETKNLSNNINPLIHKVLTERIPTIFQRFSQGIKDNLKTYAFIRALAKQSKYYSGEEDSIVFKQNFKRFIEYDLRKKSLIHKSKKPSLLFLKYRKGYLNVLESPERMNSIKINL